MTKEIQLSICIATHNRSIFLKEAISSFIPQLNDEIEIIITNQENDTIRKIKDKGTKGINRIWWDFSTDKTKEIIFRKNS